MARSNKQRSLSHFAAFSRFDRSQETIVLLETFRQHPAWSTVTLFKSDSTHLLKAKKAIPPDVEILLFPLIDFIYKTCDKRLHYYRHERVSVPARMASDIVQKRHCELADDGILEQGAYAIPYDKETCAPLEEALEKTISPVQNDAAPAMTKRYLVTVKGGHVGTHRYYPITLPILAVSMEDASQKAILLPRVKHKSLQDVLAVLEVDEETLLAQCQANRENPYFTFTSDYVAKSWLQEHRHELMDDGSTGPTETRRHRRRKR